MVIITKMADAKKIGIIGGPTFHRDGFSDSIFRWVVVNDHTELGRLTQLHIFRWVTAVPPIIPIFLIECLVLEMFLFLSRYNTRFFVATCKRSG